MRLSSYDPGEFYDELYQGVGQPRAGSALLLRKFASLPDGELKKRQQAAERVILNMGMTFGVYGSEGGHERIFPFDIVPRIVEPSDWEHIEAGLRQRMFALNLFINDVYHEQKRFFGVLSGLFLQRSGRMPSSHRRSIRHDAERDL